MVTSNNAQSYLRMHELIPALRTLARGRLATKLTALRDGFGKHLDKRCPPRDVRNFCQIRLFDTVLAAQRGTVEAAQGAGLPDPSVKMARCKRSIQLRVWGIDAIDKDQQIKEGRRYRVRIDEGPGQGAWYRSVLMHRRLIRTYRSRISSRLVRLTGREALTRTTRFILQPRRRRAGCVCRSPSHERRGKPCVTSSAAVLIVQCFMPRRDRKTSLRSLVLFRVHVDRKKGMPVQHCTVS